MKTISKRFIAMIVMAIVGISSLWLGLSMQFKPVSATGSITLPSKLSMYNIEDIVTDVSSLYFTEANYGTYTKPSDGNGYVEGAEKAYTNPSETYKRDFAFHITKATASQTVEKTYIDIDTGASTTQTLKYNTNEYDGNVSVFAMAREDVAIGVRAGADNGAVRSGLLSFKMRYLADRAMRFQSRGQSGQYYFNTGLHILFNTNSDSMISFNKIDNGTYTTADVLEDYNARYSKNEADITAILSENDLLTVTYGCYNLNSNGEVVADAMADNDIDKTATKTMLYIKIINETKGGIVAAEYLQENIQGGTSVVDHSKKPYYHITFHRNDVTYGTQPKDAFYLAGVNRPILSNEEFEYNTDIDGFYEAGTELSEIDLPDGYSFKDDTQKLVNGKNVVNVNYTYSVGDDEYTIDNYHGKPFTVTILALDINVTNVEDIINSTDDVYFAQSGVPSGISNDYNKINTSGNFSYGVYTKATDEKTDLKYDANTSAVNNNALFGHDYEYTIEDKIVSAKDLNVSANDYDGNLSFISSSNIMGAWLGKQDNSDTIVSLRMNVEEGRRVRFLIRSEAQYSSIMNAQIGYSVYFNGVNGSIILYVGGSSSSVIKEISKDDTLAKLKARYPGDSKISGLTNIFEANDSLVFTYGAIDDVVNDEVVGTYVYYSVVNETLGGYKIIEEVFDVTEYEKDNGSGTHIGVALKIPDGSWYMGSRKAVSFGGVKEPLITDYSYVVDGSAFSAEQSVNAISSLLRAGYTIKDTNAVLVEGTNEIPVTYSVDYYGNQVTKDAVITVENVKSNLTFEVNIDVGVRLEDNVNGYGGIRYSMDIDYAEFTNQTESAKDVKVYGMFMPTDEFDGTLKMDTIGKDGSSTPSTTEIPADSFKIEDGILNVKFAITDINYYNYNRKFTGRAAIVVTNQDDTTEILYTESISVSAYDIAVEDYKTYLQNQSIFAIYTAQDLAILKQYINGVIDLEYANDTFALSSANGLDLANEYFELVDAGIAESVATIQIKVKEGVPASFFTGSDFQAPIIVRNAGSAYNEYQRFTVGTSSTRTYDATTGIITITFTVA